MRISKKGYSLILDDQSGRITALCDSTNTQANWVAAGENVFFGVPFINGTQWEENNIFCAVKDASETSVKASSPVGAIELNYQFREEEFSCVLKTVTGVGPRVGLNLDWNLLDMPGCEDSRHQCMPHVLYTDEEYEYAYLIFSTPDGRYAAITMEGFAAWRIKYSYAGHRMIGFQVLTQADDVVIGNKKPLKVSDLLTLHFYFSGSKQACMEWIAKTLNIGIAIPKITGGVQSASIAYDLIGKQCDVRLCTPEGTVKDLTANEFVLEQEGIYQIVASTENGRKHISRVLCHAPWESLFDRVNTFYRNHFQDECGAFYRAIWSDTCSPKGGCTLEGTAFGDVHGFYSCRSGEFGGFGGWALMKNLLLFGDKPEIRKSLDRYVYNWVLNRGHEDQPYNGTICKHEQEYLGRKYGPYHLYREINVPQHETFFIEQLVDYYLISNDEMVLEDAWNLAKHFIAEHMESNGMVVCQNTPDGEKVDYCSVVTPICSLIKLAYVLKEKASQDAQWLLEWAEKLADFVCQRGFSFPTEGESCTEDGSVSCSVVTLLWAYQYISPKPEYLQMAKALLQYHQVLVLGGEDCRQRNSSIRFWETQYESRDWGPSINAGHAWSLWTAEAKARMAQITGDIALLQESYEGFITNICKVQPNGAMPSCYTPDMIPGLPHKPDVYGGSILQEAATELRPTTTYLAMDYVKKTYACSGNYFVIKAAELWSHICGIDLDKGVGINGLLCGGHFEAAAPELDCIVLKGHPQNPLAISCIPDKQLRIVSADELTGITVDGATVTFVDSRTVELIPNGSKITLC